MHASLPYLNLRSSRLQGPVQPALLPGLQLVMWVGLYHDTIHAGRAAGSMHARCQMDMLP